MVAIQTNRELLTPWTEAQLIITLMAALKSAGFPDPYDYRSATDSGINRYLVYEFVGSDATKAKSRIYLRIRWTVSATTGAISFYSMVFDTWSVASRTGTNGGGEATCSISPVPGTPVSFYSFSHPEIMHVVMNQGGASGTWGFLNFLRPATKLVLNSVTLFEEQQYPYGFTSSGNDFATMFSCAAALSPTGDSSYLIMLLSQLSYRTTLLNRNQRLPAPYVFSGAGQGTVCQFGAEVSILASNGMAILAESNQGGNRNVLLAPRAASGICLLCDSNIISA